LFPAHDAQTIDTRDAYCKSGHPDDFSLVRSPIKVNDYAGMPGGGYDSEPDLSVVTIMPAGATVFIWCWAGSERGPVGFESIRECVAVDEIARLQGFWRPLWSEENGVRRTSIISKMVIVHNAPDTPGSHSGEEVVWSDVIFEGEDERAAGRIRRLTLNTVLGGIHNPLPTDYHVIGGTLRVVAAGHLDRYYVGQGHVWGGPQRCLYRIKGKHLLLCFRWNDGFSASERPAELSSWQGILTRYRRLRGDRGGAD
jgi:hypothetical protein